MKIFICGASGFVGRHLTLTLRRAGHQVVRGLRTPVEPDDVAVDFRIDTDSNVWLPRLKNFDVLINAVGVLRDLRGNPMLKLHSETPAAIFSACQQAGVGRIVQISALGVDSGIDVPYFNTRLQAEHSLAGTTGLSWLCLRPSVIYGEDGESAAMFRAMAKLPVQALPMGGVQTLQPVHVDDLCAAVCRWLCDPDAVSAIVAAVGTEATTMRGMLDSYREQMHRTSAWHIAIPSPLIRVIALMGDFLPSSPMCSDTYAMLAAGNTADARAFTELLGRSPKNFRTFI